MTVRISYLKQRMADIIAQGSRLLRTIGVSTLTHTCDLLAQCFRNGTEQGNPHRTMAVPSCRVGTMCPSVRWEHKIILNAWPLLLRFEVIVGEEGGKC